jgi:serine/threonine protein kinase
MNPGSSLPKGFSAPISLGEGGQARTWLAWQDQPGRWVVVKNDPKDRGELRAEADLLARLSGAPVPSLLDKDLDAPKPWIAMDWIDGLRLDRLPQDFETPEILAIVSAAARTVSLLHNRGVVHGDLSPANLLALPSGEVLAVDLGMASFGATRLQGSWETISPERLQGNPASPASDVFALGVLALRLLGRLPATWTSSRQEWTLAVLEDALPELARDIPCLAKAVAGAPDLRPTATDLAQQLESQADAWPGERLRRKSTLELDALLERAIGNAVRLRRWTWAWRWQRERIERADDPEPLLPDLGRFARERERASRSRRPWLLAGIGAVLVATVAAFLLATDDRPAPSSRAGATANRTAWESDGPSWISTQSEIFPLPAAPPGGSLRVDGLPTDMPLDGLLLLSRGRHRIQMRDAVGVLLLDTIWLTDDAQGSPDSIPPSSALGSVP